LLKLTPLLRIISPRQERLEKRVKFLGAALHLSPSMNPTVIENPLGTRHRGQSVQFYSIGPSGIRGIYGLVETGLDPRKDFPLFLTMRRI